MSSELLAEINIALSVKSLSMSSALFVEVLSMSYSLITLHNISNALLAVRVMHYSVLAVVTPENLDKNLRQQSAKVPANTITGEEGNFLSSTEDDDLSDIVTPTPGFEHSTPIRRGPVPNSHHTTHM